MSTRYLLDTDTVPLYLRQQPLVIQKFLGHLTDEVALPVIVIEEVLAGWYTALRQAVVAGKGSWPRMID